GGAARDKEPHRPAVDERAREPRPRRRPCRESRGRRRDLRRAFLQRGREGRPDRFRRETRTGLQGPLGLRGAPATWLAAGAPAEAGQRVETYRLTTDGA